MREATAQTEERGFPAAKRYPLVLLLLCLVLFLFAWHFWSVGDDAYITFRYARNWAQGHGLRYNLGVNPPVEGFSNFLWTAFMAGIHLLGLDMVVLAPWISLFLAFVLVGLVFRYLLRVFGPHGQVPLLGIVFLVLFPPFCVWATGGLETMLFVLLLFVTYERFLGGAGRPRGWQAGMSAGLLALTRPEGLLWGLAFGVIYALRRRDAEEKIFDIELKKYLFLLVTFAIVFLAARLLYFHRLLPNVASVKLGFSSLILKRGAFYVINFFLTFITAAVLLPIIPVLILWKGWSPPDREMIARVSLVIGGVILFSIVAGGDFMAMGRFIVPAAPFFAILFAALARMIRKKGGWPRRILLPVMGVFLLVHVLPSFDLHLVPREIRKVFHFRWNNRIFLSEYEQIKYTGQRLEQWIASGKALREYSAGSGSLVCPAIGALGYYSGLFIYDQFGLVSSEKIRRAAAEPKTLSAGHDSPIPVDHFLQYEPTYIMIQVILEKRYPRLLDQLVEAGLPSGYQLVALPLERSSEPENRFLCVCLERKAGAE